MNDIPKVGDTVTVNTERFTGVATITFIDLPALYVHHQYPIQCEISEGDLDKLLDFNHGQTTLRFSLKEILSIQYEPVPAANTSKDEDNLQLDLFCL